MEGVTLTDLIAKARMEAAQAWRKAGRPGGHDGYEDFVGDALEGLVIALANYDPEQGVKPWTFCQHRVRGRIKDGQRRMDWWRRHKGERPNYSWLSIEDCHFLY